MKRIDVSIDLDRLFNLMDNDDIDDESGWKRTIRRELRKLNTEILYIDKEGNLPIFVYGDYTKRFESVIKKSISMGTRLDRDSADKFAIDILNMHYMQKRIDKINNLLKDEI